MNPATLIRPSSPSSPVGAGPYESVEGSAEEDHLLENGEEDTYDGDFDDDNDTNDDMIADGERNGGSEMVSSRFLLHASQEILDCSAMCSIC